MPWYFARHRQLMTKQQFKELIMGELQDAVNTITAQLDKAKSEIVSKIDVLEAQIAAGETPDLTALRQAAQALDDVVPDTVEEPPA